MKKLEYIKLKSDMEVSTLKYKKYKSRSKEVKIECDKQIVNYLTIVRTLENDIKKIQMNKREIANAIATIVI